MSDAEPTGREPVRARSAHRLRIALAAVGMFVGIVAAIGACLAIEPSGARTASVLAGSALALGAAANIVAVLVSRSRRQHG